MSQADLNTFLMFRMWQHFSFETQTWCFETLKLSAHRTTWFAEVIRWSKTVCRRWSLGADGMAPEWSSCRPCVSDWSTHESSWIIHSNYYITSSPTKNRSKVNNPSQSIRSQISSATSQDQIDMASASQSRFRVIHEPRKRGKDDLLSKVAIDAASWSQLDTIGCGHKHQRGRHVHVQNISEHVFEKMWLMFAG